MSATRARARHAGGARLWLGAYVVLFSVFLVAPIVSVVLVSFSDSAFIVFPIPGWSLRWYGQIVRYRPLMDGLAVSLEVALASAAAGALLGVPAALFLARSRARASVLVANLLLAPISVPAIVLGFALLYFLAATEVGISFAALVIAHTVVAIPYVVRTVLATYRAIPVSLEECASILGAGRWQTVRHVTLPLVRPGVFAGALFAVLTSPAAVVLLRQRHHQHAAGGDAELHAEPA